MSLRCRAYGPVVGEWAGCAHGTVCGVPGPPMPQHGLALFPKGARPRGRAGAQRRRDGPADAARGAGHDRRPAAQARRSGPASRVAVVLQLDGEPLPAPRCLPSQLQPVGCAVMRGRPACADTSARTPPRSPMPAPDPARTAGSAPEGSASTVWTLALATALIGLVALPRRTGPPAPRPADRSGDRSAGRDGARRTSPSHAGQEAQAVARTQADRGRGPRRRPRSPPRVGRTSRCGPITTSARTACR